MNLLAANEVTLTTEWIGVMFVGFGVVTGALAFYIKQVVKNATISLNQVNGGTHLADLPKQMVEVKAQLATVSREAAEAKTIGQILLTNQRELMAEILGRTRKDSNE